MVKGIRSLVGNGRKVQFWVVEEPLINLASCEIELVRRPLQNGKGLLG